MFRRLNRWVILACASLIILATACVQMVAPVMGPNGLPMPLVRSGGMSVPVTTPTPAAMIANPMAEQTPTAGPATGPFARAHSAGDVSAATPTPRAQVARQTATVRTGPIAQSIQLNGRVAALQEVPLTFSASGTVDQVSVQSGQPVQSGDVLASLDVKDAAHSLSDAQSLLQISQLQQQQLQTRLAALARAREAAASSEQADNARRQQAADQRVQDATTQAQDQLRQAQDNLAKVTAGASATEKLAAQGAVATAQGALDRAQADLNKLQTGPSQASVLAAQQALIVAQAGLRKAQVEHDKLTAPPDPSVVAAARRDVADAEAELARAKESTGPTGQKIGDAERQQRQNSAQFSVTIAKNKLDALLKGPDKASVDLATLSVQGAETEVEIAQARLNDASAIVTPEQISAAASGVDAARKGLEGAQAHLADVNSHPTAAELADAQSRVAQAQQALERAPQAADSGSNSAATAAAGTTPGVSGQSGQDDDAAAVQLLQLQHTIDQQRAQVATLQQQLDTSQLRAPFSGVVETVQVRPGESVDKRRQVMVLAGGEDPVVTADMPDDNAGLTVGKPVSLRLDSNEIAGKVADVRDTGASARTIIIQVDWPSDRPVLGSAVQITVAVQQKSNALLVPVKAVRSSGDRKTVDILDENQQRRTVDVTVGISSASDAEILSGLAEGQQVIIPN